VLAELNWPTLVCNSERQLDELTSFLNSKRQLDELTSIFEIIYPF
jgi:hypothetical protein